MIAVLSINGALVGAEVVHRDGDVVAVIAGAKISRAEVSQKESAKLLQARNQYYLAERDALEQFIDDYLLEQKASREHLTVDALVKRDIESKVQDPTDDQLQVYYEGVGTEEPYPAVRDKILGYIRQHRIKRARAEYLKVLREDAGVSVFLAPPTADVNVAGAFLRGAQGAPVQLVEFADYECPYCQQVDPLVRKLEHEFDGKVTVAFKDFPLPMHHQAEKAAEASRCAGAQGHYWEFHDLLFEKPGQLDIAQLKEDARTLRLDTGKFDKCLDDGEQAATVKKDVDEAHRLGLTGTPSFFVNGHFASGSVKYEMLHDLVEQGLTETTASAAK